MTTRKRMVALIAALLLVNGALLVPDAARATQTEYKCNWTCTTNTHCVQECTGLLGSCGGSSCTGSPGCCH